MEMENWKQKAYYFMFLGCLLFVILIFLAMLFYTGGTVDNPNIQGYSFWANTFSDSGRTVAHSGKTNILSMVFFSASYALFGILTIPFFMALRQFFVKIKFERIMSNIGTIFGIISSISLVGIAVTPADILYGPHMIFVYIAYISLFAMGVLFSIAMYLNEEFPKNYAYAFIIFTIIYFISSMMGLVGLASNRNIMVIGQKISWFAKLLCFAYVGYGALKLEKGV